MNTIHDMGGMHGFGPVVPEVNEPVFHEEWEGRVFAMTRAMGAARLWTIDNTRSDGESLSPQTYISVKYYERWFLGLTGRMLKHRFVDADEIEAGHKLRDGPQMERLPLSSADFDKQGRPDFSRSESAPPGFKAGDKVRIRNINPTTHTRLPRYTRDKIGVVEANRGCHVFPDSVTIGKGDDPQWLYTVVIPGQELWGAESDSTITVSIEAFEPYLEPA